MTEEDMTRFRGLVLQAMSAAGGTMRLGDLVRKVAEVGGWARYNDRQSAFVVAARRSLEADGTLQVWRDLNERNHPEMVTLVEQGSGPWLR
ncbi:MAG TPA: hypothetical protein VGW74_19765 [Propionibacteriaceae bacterium]|nr:hypothetical protein [Propionibacteriaceae bacterium]